MDSLEPVGTGPLKAEAVAVRIAPTTVAALAEPGVTSREARLTLGLEIDE